jgi:hypothetical protein
VAPTKLAPTFNITCRRNDAENPTITPIKGAKNSPKAMIPGSPNKKIIEEPTDPPPLGRVADWFQLQKFLAYHKATVENGAMRKPVVPNTNTFLQQSSSISAIPLSIGNSVSAVSLQCQLIVPVIGSGTNP